MHTGCLGRGPLTGEAVEGEVPVTAALHILSPASAMVTESRATTSTAEAMDTPPVDASEGFQPMPGAVSPAESNL